MLEIAYFKKLDSTHKFLLKNIKENKLKPPFMIVSENQDNGVGTGDNKWISLEGNLFLSFVISSEQIPKDLPKQSISIYFAYLLKEVLSKRGSSVWLKWPNDFYVKNKKVGGVLSYIYKENIICSIGLNLKKSPDNFGILDINIEKNQLIKELILNLKSKKSWKGIFKKYQVEFEKSKSFETKIGKTKVSMSKAVLQKDGSIQIERKKVYSLR